MSLDTLLEAARYLELQEQQQQQQQQVPVSILQQPQLTPSLLLPANTSSIEVKPKQVRCVQASDKYEIITPQRLIQNSFDIINPLVIDEAGEQKRKQPPLVFRSGTREVHNKLEKHRRAHLKECFDYLKKQLPAQADEKKTSNLSILHSALRYIQSLKRKERELEHEMERLAREKITAQQKLSVLKKEISSHYDNIDFSLLLPETVPNSEAKNVPVAPVNERMPIPPLRTTTNGIKEGTTVQTTAVSVLPVGYPVGQGLVLHKVALVPKSITELSPLGSVAHFITTPQQINGKVVPVVNAQYVVKPVVVVSSPSISTIPRPS